MFVLLLSAISLLLLRQFKRIKSTITLKAIPAYVPQKRLPKRKNPLPDIIPTFYY